MDYIMSILGIIQLVTGIICLFYEYKKGSISVFFWGAIIFMFHFPHMLSSVGINSDYPSWVYCSASAFAIFFDLLYLFTRILLVRNKNYNAIISMDERNIEFNYAIEHKYAVYYTLCIIITTAIISIFIRRVSGSLLESSWGRILNNNASGPILILFNLIPFFVDAAGGILAHFILEKKWKSLIVYLAIFAFSIIIRREKQRFLVVAVPFLLVLFINNRNLNLKSFIKYLLYALVGYSLVLVLAFMRDGSLGDFLSNFDPDVITNYMFNSVLTSSGELGVRRAFYLFIYNHNNYLGFNMGADYIRMMLFWLPTSLSFGIKPSDFAVTMGSAYLGVASQTSYSMHPTIYGECFANLNWVGVLLSIYWTMLFSYIDRKIVSSDTVMLKLGIANVAGVCYIMIARGSAYNGFFTIIMSLIVLRIMDFVFKRIKILPRKYR